MNTIYISADRMLSDGAVDTDVWAVVQTHPHKECFAASNLLRQGFSVYCPMIRKKVRHARRTSEVRRPLFPGYLFVCMPADVERWRPVHSTFGVSKIVGHGGQPSVLDGAFIRCLRKREVDGCIIRPEQPFHIGQHVRIASGAFEGVVATIISVDERDRLTLLMDLLKQSVKVTTDSSGVWAV